MTDRTNSATGCDTSVTVFTKADGILSKRIWLSPEGRMQSDSSYCKMWEGTAKRAKVNTAAELAEIIGTCTSRVEVAQAYRTQTD